MRNEDKQVIQYFFFFIIMQQPKLKYILIQVKQKIDSKQALIMKHQTLSWRRLPCFEPIRRWL